MTSTMAQPYGARHDRPLHDTTLHDTVRFTHDETDMLKAKLWAGVAESRKLPLANPQG